MKLARYAGWGFAALVALEAALRLSSYLSPRAALDSESYHREILMFGDGFTSGLGNDREVYLADQLRPMVEELPGEKKPELLNWPVVARNTSELLAYATHDILMFHPKTIIVMAGEANFWNLHHLHLYLDGKPTLWGFLRQLEVVRLFTSAPPLFPEPPGGRSVFFFDVPLVERPTLAMRWTGYLVAHRDNLYLTDEEAAEAESALRGWLADSRAGDQPLAARALVDLLRYREESNEARRAEEQYLVRAMPGGAAIFRNPSVMAKELKWAEMLAREGHTAEALEKLREAFRVNPYLSGGEPPAYSFFRYLSAEEFRAVLADAFPPGVTELENPGLHTLRESFLEPAELSAWVTHDLIALVRYARAHGAETLLVTYPPERFTGRERPVDAAIRRAAAATGAPLSDVSSELRKRWDGRALEQYYGTPGFPGRDDHLNEEGNALVANIILGDLVRFHLVN
jgi:hypothetical protein